MPAEAPALSNEQARARWHQSGGRMLSVASVKRLRAAIEASGLTQRALAEKAGCSPGMIAHLAVGRRTDVTAVLAEAVAEALGADVKDLFGTKEPSDGRRDTERKAAS